MENVDNKNYWIITVSNPWCNSILLDYKTMEIRKNVPSNLNVGDIIFIVRKGNHGHIVGACRVESVLRKPLIYFLNHHSCEHRLSGEMLKKYVGKSGSLCGIGLKILKSDSWGLTVRSFGFERSPQWFYKISPEYKSTIERVLA